MTLVLEGTAGPVELLTYREAADLLDVVTPTIHTYAHRGLLHPIRLAATAGLDWPHKSDLPFLLRDELEWYDRRRRLGVPAAGPNPYAARYAELLATGAASPLLDTQAAELLARIRGADIAPSMPPAQPATERTAPRSTAEALDALDSLDAGAVAGLGWGVLAALLFLIVLAFIAGRQPDAGKVAQLRAMPGAGRLPRALRDAADLLDKAA